jgi:hypothetical protein
MEADTTLIANTFGHNYCAGLGRVKEGLGLIKHHLCQRAQMITASVYL